MNSTNSPRQQHIEGDLVALVNDHAISLRCGPVGVPNHAPIPLLALYLKTCPRNIVSAQVGHIQAGVYVDPASKEIEEDYVLDPKRPARARQRPAGLHRGEHEPFVADLQALRIALSGPCTPRRDPGHPAPIAAHDSGPGAPAAPAGDRLRLLPSGPDLVRKPTPRGTRTIDAPSDGATGAETPRKGIQPR